MRSNRKLMIDLALALGAILMVTGAAGCKKKDGGGGGGGGGAWLVGADGSMANLNLDGTLGPGYDLGVDQDLLAITCRGKDTAFVVGEGGTLLRTFDGGETWESIDVGTTATLRDVAAAGSDTVFVAGDQALLVTRDSGDTWHQMPAAPRAWQSVATHHGGLIALLLDDAGGVWRWDEAAGVMQQETTLAGARALTLSHDGTLAAVVGDDGAMSRSDDGGLTWTTVATGSGADLYATWATDGGEIVAVGEAGTVVHVAGDIEVSQPGTATLRAVHIDAAGIGLAAGDGGQVLQSDDGGQTWDTVDVPLTATIYGLDAIDGAGHL